MESGVYIVGAGSISPLGACTKDAFEAYAAGTRGIRSRRIGDREVAVGALSAEGEERVTLLGREQSTYGRLDRSTRLAVLAAREALREAGAARDGAAMGVILGSSRGATESLEASHGKFCATGRVAAHTSPTTTLGNLSSNVARELDAGGLVAEISCACSTAMQALVLGVAWLRAGLGRACLVGGSEAPLTAFTLAQMHALGLLGDASEADVRYEPMSRSPRNRLILGEGACVFVIEQLSAGEALERGALAEIAGIGTAVEKGPSFTGISASGTGLVRAMNGVLARHGRAVDAVVVHAPGTKNGDAAELAAVAEVFDRRVPALCSSKWQMGHTLGASGAFGIELGLSLLSGLRPSDPPYPSELRAPEGDVDSVLINAAGFGGVAASVLLRRPDTR